MAGFDPNMRIKSVPEQAFEELLDEIKRFQDRLPADKEIGITANGAGLLIRVESIRWTGQMIVFQGVDDQGQHSSLIQHYTQANVQMVAVPTLTEEPLRIGF